MSQKEKILEILKDGKFHCTNEMYASFIADPRTRICELKKQDYTLEPKPCNLHNNHIGGSKMWRLVEKVSIGVYRPEIIKERKLESLKLL